jgi:hypothetical protein
MMRPSALALASILAGRESRAADSSLVEAARKEARVVWYTTLIARELL